jgi:hypothetical protein
MPSPSWTDILTAVASFATAVATFGIIVTAWIQVRDLRAENKKWSTVRACTSYTTDPILFECARKIRDASKGKDYSITNIQPVMQEVRAVLNYLDSLAVGVAQKIYSEAIIRDNLEFVIVSAVDNFCTDSYKEELKLEGFEHLIAMRNRWKPKEQIHFK